MKKELSVENEKLIKHLEELVKSENESLVNFAVEAMSHNDKFPFEKNITEKQKEYKLMEQRVLGIIDTVEEVKAFMEGWYAGDDNTTANEKEKHHQSIK